jgi:hypothetical protein
VFQDTVTAKISKIEAVGARVIGAGPDGLEEQEHGIAVLYVEAIKHAILKLAQRNVLAISWKVSMVSQSVEAWARSASCCHVQSAPASFNRLPNSQSPGPGAIHSWGAQVWRASMNCGNATAEATRPAAPYKKDVFIALCKLDSTEFEIFANG